MDAEQRRSYLITGENGRPFSLWPDVHGTSTARCYWMCSCEECLAFGRTYSRRARERRQHNLAVLATLESDRQEPPPLDLSVLRQRAEPDWRELDLPPMTAGVRAHVVDDDQIEEIRRAYHAPDTVVQQAAGARRHYTDVAELLIADTGVVLFAAYRPEERKPVDYQIPGMKKAKGGGHGSQIPRTSRDLIDRVKGMGCTSRRVSNGHIEVTCPNGNKAQIPSTGSDHRGLANSWHLIMRLMKEEQ